MVPKSCTFVCVILFPSGRRSGVLLGEKMCLIQVLTSCVSYLSPHDQFRFVKNVDVFAKFKGWQDHAQEWNALQYYQQAICLSPREQSLLAAGVYLKVELSWREEPPPVVDWDFWSGSMW